MPLDSGGGGERLEYLEKAPGVHRGSMQTAHTESHGRDWNPGDRVMRLQYYALHHHCAASGSMAVTENYNPLCQRTTITG